MAFLPGNTRPPAGPASYPDRNFRLVIVQQPKEGRTLPKNQRMKGHTWPVDPPPVLELVSTFRNEEEWFYIHNPNWFCLAELVVLSLSDSPQSRKREEAKEIEGGMSGSWSSSLHKVRGSPAEADRKEHGYFVFGDINVKNTGTYQLKFTLFEMRRHDDHIYATKVNHTTSDTFRVHSNKGETTASTRFSRMLSDAGVKVKLRAEATKRKPMKIDWSSKQTDSMSRQLHLAPMHDSFAPSPTQGELRGRGNVSIDISGRVQTTHAPLAALVVSPMGPVADNTGHQMNSRMQQYTSPTHQLQSHDWPVTVGTAMQALPSHYNPYARTSEQIQYASTLPFQPGPSQLSMRPPTTLSDDTGYGGGGQPVWFQQHHHPQHPQQQPQQQWYPQQQYQ